MSSWWFSSSSSSSPHKTREQLEHDESLHEVEQRIRHKFSRYVTAVPPPKWHPTFPLRVFAAVHMHTVAALENGAGGEGGADNGSNSSRRASKAGGSNDDLIMGSLPGRKRRASTTVAVVSGGGGAAGGPAAESDEQHRLRHHNQRMRRTSIDGAGVRAIAAEQDKPSGGFSSVIKSMGNSSSSSSSESSDGDVESRAQLDADLLLEEQMRIHGVGEAGARHRRGEEDGCFTRCFAAALTAPKSARALSHSSLFIFPAHWGARVVCYNTFKHKVFEYTMLFFIVLNCILLAVEDLSLFGGDSVAVYEAFENVFVGVFSFEMFVKVLALGFVAHKGAYVRDWWNLLDFVIMILTYLNYIQGSGSFTALRSLRVLRPLRTLNAIPGLKILVRSFLASLRAMGPVALLSMMVIYVFAIIGVQLFQGEFRRSCVNDLTGENTWLSCRNGTTVPTDSSYWGFRCPIHHTCRNVGNPGNGYYSFDNLLTSILVIFSFATFDGWTIALERSVGSVGVITFLFFGFCVLVVGILLPNLVLAVINLEYAREQTRDSDQRRYYNSRVRQLLAQKLNALTLRSLGGGGAAASRRKIAHRGSGSFPDSDETPVTKDSSYSNPLLFNGGRFGWNVPEMLMSARDGVTSQASSKGRANSPTTVNNNSSSSKKQPARIIAETATKNNNSNQVDVVAPSADGMSRLMVGDVADAATRQAATGERDDEDDAIIEEDLQDDGNVRRNSSNNNNNSNNNGSRNNKVAQRNSDDTFVEQEMREVVAVSPRRLAPLDLSQPQEPRQRTGEDRLSPSSSPSPSTRLHRREHPASPLKAAAKAIVKCCTIPVSFLHQIDDWRDACHELTEGFPRSSAQAAAIHVSRSNTSIAKSFSHSTNTGTTHENDMAMIEMRKQEQEAAEAGRDVASGESTAQVDSGQIRSTWFTNIIVFVILLNTLVLASVHHQQPAWLDDTQRISNLVFTVIFTIEMIMRLFSVGFRVYVSSPFDLLDGIIVLSSLIELAFSGGEGTSVVSVFRGLRLLRVMKLLKQFPSLRSVVRVALYAMADSLYLMLIVLLYIFIFSLLGKAVFSGKLSKPGTVDEIERNAHTSFDSFVLSFYASFQIMSMDLWVWVMYEIMDKTHPLAALFFVVQIITGGFILVSLFLSILVAAFRKLESRANGNAAKMDGADPDVLRNRQNAFKQNMLDATLVQRVYRFGTQGRGTGEFDKKGFTSMALGVDSFLRAANSHAIISNLSAPMAKEFRRAKAHKEEEKRRLAMELKRRESTRHIQFSLRAGVVSSSSAAAAAAAAAAANNGGGMVRMMHGGDDDNVEFMESISGGSRDSRPSSDDEDEYGVALRAYDEVDVIDLENLHIREDNDDPFLQSVTNMNMTFAPGATAPAPALMSDGAGSGPHNNTSADDFGSVLNIAALRRRQLEQQQKQSHNLPMHRNSSINPLTAAALQSFQTPSASHQQRERKASLSVNNLQEHTATTAEVREIEKKEAAFQLRLLMLERQRRLRNNSMFSGPINLNLMNSSTNNNNNTNNETDPNVTVSPRKRRESTAVVPDSLELLIWQQRSSEFTHRMNYSNSHGLNHSYGENNNNGSSNNNSFVNFSFSSHSGVTLAEDLAPELPPSRYMLRHQFALYRKAKRANSANRFFAAAPLRSAIEETLRAVPNILSDHGPLPEDPPPQVRLPTCRQCGEELVNALPPAPLVAQPSPEVLHSLRCGRVRMRRARTKILRELLHILHFYIRVNEPPLLQKLDTLIAQAWEVDTMLTIRAEDFVGLPEPWQALEKEIKEELEVLDLRVGEDELGKSLIAQVFATIPTQHQTNGGWSLFVFGPENPFRRHCSQIVASTWFEMFILFCVILSSALMAVSNPLDDPDSLKGQIGFIGNLVFTIIFTVEAVMKIIALGFYFTPQGAYISDPWNVLDFAIVVSSLISDTQNELDLSFLKVFRTLRATRALRVLRRARGMKTVVYALVQNIKAIANVGLLCFILLLIFAILAVQVFQGQFRHCTDLSMPPHPANCTGYWWDPNAESRHGNNATLLNLTLTQYNVTLPANTSYAAMSMVAFSSFVGAVVERQIVPDFQNFDNVFRALLTLFQITSSEGWMFVVWRATDTCDPASGRDLNCRQEGGLFFVAFFAFSAFFLMQLFVSFIIYNFEKVNRTVSGSEFLTAEQRIWVSTQQLVSNFKPTAVVGPMRDVAVSVWLHVNVLSRLYFDIIVALLILADVVILSLDHYDMSSDFKSSLEISSIVISFCFLVEAAIKLACYGVRYFRSSENRFDFFLVIIAVLSSSNIVGVDLGFLVVLRVIRLSRILRLLRFAKGIQILLETIVYSLPSIANMGAFVVLITFSFGVLGVDVFAKTYIPPNALVLNGRYTNFRQLDSALMLLFRFLTLEDWVGVMIDASVESPTCANSDSCGGFMVPLYFSLYVIATSYIVLNLIMASMLVQFELTMTLDARNPKMAILHRFVERWSEYDPDAEMLIETKNIPQMLAKLGPPMGLLRAGSRLDILRKMGTFFIPEHAGQVHFMEVLLALEMGLSPPKEDDADRIKREFFVMMTDNFPELEKLPVMRINNGRMFTADLHFAQTYLAAAERRRQAYRSTQELLRIQAMQRWSRKSMVKSLLLEGDDYFEMRTMAENNNNVIPDELLRKGSFVNASLAQVRRPSYPAASRENSFNHSSSVILPTGSFFNNTGGIGARIDSRMGSRLGSRAPRDGVVGRSSNNNNNNNNSIASHTNNNNNNSSMHLLLVPNAKAVGDSTPATPLSNNFNYTSSDIGAAKAPNGRRHQAVSFTENASGFEEVPLSDDVVVEHDIVSEGSDVSSHAAAGTRQPRQHKQQQHPTAAAPAPISPVKPALRIADVAPSSSLTKPVGIISSAASSDNENSSNASAAAAAPSSSSRGALARDPSAGPLPVRAPRAPAMRSGASAAATAGIATASLVADMLLAQQQQQQDHDTIKSPPIMRLKAAAGAVRAAHKFKIKGREGTVVLRESARSEQLNSATFTDTLSSVVSSVLSSERRRFNREDEAEASSRASSAASSVSAASSSSSPSPSSASARPVSNSTALFVRPKLTAPRVIASPATQRGGGSRADDISNNNNNNGLGSEAGVMKEATPSKRFATNGVADDETEDEGEQERVCHSTLSVVTMRATRQRGVAEELVRK